MTIKLGNSSISKCYLGSTVVNKIYQGVAEAYSSFDPLSDPNLLVWLGADNPSNTTTTINQTFTPANVNTTTDKITMSASGFTRLTTYRFGVFYFSTTGTLPSPLVENTPYVGVDNADGTFSFYPYNSDADYASFPSYDAGETIFAGHSYMLDRNKINFTTQGTGTHTIYTDRLLKGLQNKVTSSDLFTESTNASCYRILNDAKGDYIYLDGITALASDFVEPQGKQLNDNKTGTEIGTIFENKRYLATIAVIKPLSNPYISKNRSILIPSNLNIATGVFTNNAHSLITGEKVTVVPMSDNGVIPTPVISFGSDIFVRAVNANTFTLHPTATDATNNTNTYLYSNAGTGIFSVVGGSSVKTSASNRRMLIDLNMQSNDHAHTSIVFDMRETLSLSSGAIFLSGSLDGEVTTIDVSKTGGAWTILRIQLYIPSNATAPICDDTGLPLASGIYWVTKSTETSRRRFHRTLANAQASVGVLTSTIPNTQCIKYGTLGTGTAMLYVLDTFNYQPFDDSFNKTNAVGINTFNDFGVYVNLVDYNDGVTGKRIYSSGVNSSNNMINGLQSSYNSPLPAKSTNSSLTLGNTGQPHVPGHYQVYDVFMIGSDTDPTTSITNLINYAKSKYGIA